MHSFVLIGEKSSFLKSFIEDRLGDHCRVLFYPSMLDLYPDILSEQPLVLFFQGAGVSENELGVIGVLKRTFPHLKVLSTFPEDRRAMAARAIAQGADAYLLEPLYLEELEQFLLQAFRNARNEIDHAVSLRMEALAVFIQGLAPEINNRITPIRAALHMLRDDKTEFADEKELEELYKRMEREVYRIGGTVNELEHFAKPRRPKKNKVSLNNVVEKAIQAACTDSRNECPVTYQALTAQDEAVLDPEQIAHALAAVIRILKENADDEDGSVGVGISQLEEDRFVITIEGRNTLSLGEEVHNAFVPLYLRNIVRFGHEIGVAAAYGIVGAHKGTIRIETIPHGTRFLISLPKI